MRRYIACISARIEDIVRESPETFVRVNYIERCDRIESDMKTLLEKGFQEVVKLDERRDGEEYAVAFGFNSESPDPVIEAPLYLHGEYDIRPYTPGFTLEQLKSMK